MVACPTAVGGRVGGLSGEGVAVGPAVEGPAAVVVEESADLRSGATGVVCRWGRRRGGTCGRPGGGEEGGRSGTVRW